MMVMILRVVFLILLLGGTGCITSKDRFDRSMALASEVYLLGSSYSGDGEELFLFDDGRWERWVLSCTEVSKSAAGRFERLGEKVILYPENGEKPLVYNFHSLKGERFLLDEGELKAAKTDPSRFRDGIKPGLMLVRKNRA